MTERRTAETRFQQLLESAPDGVVLVDAQGQIKLVNRRTEELFGYEPGELIDREVELLVPDRLPGRASRASGPAMLPRLGRARWGPGSSCTVVVGTAASFQSRSA